jgi:hypothetical protein
MIDHNILWSRAIGFDGRVVKEPTVLGAALLGIALFAGIGALLFLFVFL